MLAIFRLLIFILYFIGLRSHCDYVLHIETTTDYTAGRGGSSITAGKMESSGDRDEVIKT